MEAAADGEEAEVDCVEAEVDCVSGFGKLPRLKENIKSTERSRWALCFPLLFFYLIILQESPPTAFGGL